MSMSAATMATVWSSAHGLRMADGVRIVDEDADSVRMQVSMPTNEHGFFGRQCPSCSQLFGGWTLTTTGPCPKTSRCGACTAAATASRASSSPPSSSTGPSAPSPTG
jgi:hypothetical protein